RRFLDDALGSPAPGRGLRAGVRPHAGGGRRALDPRLAVAPGGALDVERLRAQPDAGDRAVLDPAARTNPTAPHARAAASRSGRATAQDRALAAVRGPS